MNLLHKMAINHAGKFLWLSFLIVGFRFSAGSRIVFRTETSGSSAFQLKIEQYNPPAYKMIRSRNYLKKIPVKYLEVLMAINRVDHQSLFRKDSIVVPDSLTENLLYYSPFPSHLSILDSVKKFTFLYYPIQAFAVYESGQLIRWGPVSMGRNSAPTPEGLFHTNWKSPSQISTIDTSWIMKWYFNIENFQGISMHQYNLPGYPASHGCIRMLEKDAFWFYHWADQWILNKKMNAVLCEGTPVIVSGKYPFGERSPWKNLALNPRATDVSEETMEREIAPFIEKILSDGKSCLHRTQVKSGK